MRRPRNRGLSPNRWPARDAELWNATLENDDPLADNRVAHLAPASRNDLKYTYRLFLGFIARERPNLVDVAPADRLDRTVTEDYVRHLRGTCNDTTVAAALERLYRVFSIMCPERDWAWLRKAGRHIHATARAKPKPFVTGDTLYTLGVELMDQAIEAANVAGSVSEEAAVLYRDGLMIALLATIALRRGAFSKLTLGRHLMRCDDGCWLILSPASENKNRQEVEHLLKPTLSEFVDTYLDRFRPAFPGADQHDGLWPSLAGRTMESGQIGRRIKKHTREALGTAISPHRFRDAAATFLSIHDSEDVRVAKDLLGHRTFDTTEKHYIRATTRVAGRKAAGILDSIRKAGKGRSRERIGCRS